MNVGELIELLEQHPKDIEVLIEFRNLNHTSVCLERSSPILI